MKVLNVFYIIYQKKLYTTHVRSSGDVSHMAKHFLAVSGGNDNLFIVLLMTSPAVTSLGLHSNSSSNGLVLSFA